MRGTKNDPSAMTPAALRARLGARSIVLVGMPGSGKSSIGRRLAQYLGIEFVDADQEIEAAAGMSIADIFAKHGEPYFRAGEARVIARLLDKSPQVVATGGGAFVNPDTRALVRARALSVWLKADVDLLLRRVKRKNDRPLLRVADPEAALKRLLAEREAIYAEADITVTSLDVPHEAVVEMLVKALANKLAAENAKATTSVAARS
ncbi:MAG TPA: shikimate kinase [Xanthobacteraceae bacterium]|nr:shikimate kinase [Xanthobacteraceae bacterium]